MGLGSIRAEMARDSAAMRVEMSQDRASMRVEMAQDRAQMNQRFSQIDQRLDQIVLLFAGQQEKKEAEKSKQAEKDESWCR